MPIRRFAFFAAAAICLSQTQPAQAALLSFQFSDTVGDVDVAGMPDIHSLEIVFDNTTGWYRMALHATESAPFVWDFVFDTWMRNVDRDRTFDQRTWTFESPPLSSEWTGSDTDLIGWQAGDRVNSWSISRVHDLEITEYSVLWGRHPSEDRMIGADYIDVGQTVIVAVPEPEIGVAFIFGLAGVAAARRRSMRNV